MKEKKKAFRQLRKTGQLARFEEIEELVIRFEKVLRLHGIEIKKGSDLEGACCSIFEVIGKKQDKRIRQPREDIRHLFTEVHGLWIFLKKIVRHHKHPSFKSFAPHLQLLSSGTVGQNTRLRASEDATNKIFELLFALVLLGLGKDVRLAHPDKKDTSNPDILATIDGQVWGFACKTIYGPSAKTFFDNIKKAVDQIEVSAATVGCVMTNLRNALDHNSFWPILNEEEYRNGGEPIFGAFVDPGLAVVPLIWEAVLKKRDEVFNEIGRRNVLNVFSGKKAIPGFLAFCQTVTGKASAIGPMTASITTLNAGNFDDIKGHIPLFEKMNFALHERPMAYSAGDNKRSRAVVPKKRRSRKFKMNEVP